jgi:hypothetical protein
MTSSSAAKAYFASTDYYKSCPGDWLGKGAEMLGLVGSANSDHFYSLADNLDPAPARRYALMPKTAIASAWT